MTEPRSIELDIELREGDHLGATLDARLVVIQIEAGSIAAGMLKVGDQITKLNGQKVTDIGSFHEALRSAPPAESPIIRDVRDNKEASERCPVPRKREKNFKRRDGYSYFVTELKWKRGQQLGLALREITKTYILVAITGPRAVSSEALAVGDRILDIDSKPANGKDALMSKLVVALNKKGAVTFVIERPESKEAMKEVAYELGISHVLYDVPRRYPPRRRI